MRADRNDLAHCANIEGVVAVINVPRSFTTAAVDRFDFALRADPHPHGRLIRALQVP